RRWHDPVFPRTWPQFATPEHWEQETGDLEAQLRRAELAERGVAERQDEPEAEAAADEPTNADIFWDWDDGAGRP
ncbi:MAG: hypothetical protein ACREI7_01680, partial [Myxococcota bacterium]